MYYHRTIFSLLYMAMWLSCLLLVDVLTQRKRQTMNQQGAILRQIQLGVGRV